MDKKQKKIVILIVLCIILLFPTVSLVKYALYEISGIRNAIGKYVILPEEDAHTTLRNMMGVTNRGTLQSAKYRWNDKVGFFDLELGVTYKGEKLGTRHLKRGLSPFEAMRVTIEEVDQSHVRN